MISEHQIFCKYCRQPGDTHKSCEILTIEYNKTIKFELNPCEHKHVIMGWNSDNEYTERCRNCLKPVKYNRTTGNYEFDPSALKTKNLVNYLINW